MPRVSLERPWISMPDSPVDVKNQIRPAGSSPTMPPPPTTQGASRATTFTATANKVHLAMMVFHRFDATILLACWGKWRVGEEEKNRYIFNLPDAVLNGRTSNHSPTIASMGGSPSSPPGSYHGNGPSPSPSSSSSSSASSVAAATASALGAPPPPLPPACGARQLSKLKRFLATLQQFGSDISPEIGERVRALVLGLVTSTLTIEEFHSKLQEATNFPLRPFVIPFLKANLPLLQRELLHCARLAKVSPAQYLTQHQHLLLDAGAPGLLPPAHHGGPVPAGPAGPPHGPPSPPYDSAEMLLDVGENGKRRTPDRMRENGNDRDSMVPASKRTCTVSPGQRFNPSQAANGLGPSHHAPAPTMPLAPPLPPPLPTSSGSQPSYYPTHGPRPEGLGALARPHSHSHASAHYRDSHLRERHRSLGMHAPRQEEVIDHRLTDREWAEEWKHLDNLLNCILEMVEKTRRAIAVLRRCQEADRQEINRWIRRYGDAEEIKKGCVASSSSGLVKPHGVGQTSAALLDAHRDFSARPGVGYMPEEIWRKAEEAVNEVKRQAMTELQKAVAEAERQARSTIANERTHMERALSEAKRQATEEALSLVGRQEDSSESCWNCGRKASETCSGCNAARYCGSFCQHKDWERHHHVCGTGLAATQHGQPKSEPGQRDGGSSAAGGTAATAPERGRGRATNCADEANATNGASAPGTMDTASSR
uniref:CBFA2/RUNX1 partner transcriptional co-repressor 3 n=1 Tax=Eptatretus burgeri TaxID=7764 RepID=A0A8C4QY29_EPTBU